MTKSLHDVPSTTPANRSSDFHRRPRQVYVRIGDIVAIHGGALAGHTGRVVHRSPIGVHVTIPGLQLPAFIATRHLLESEESADD